MSTPTDVVIYGGGMAGAILAKRLSTDRKVLLVDPRDYFEVPMAAPRNLVDPGFAEQATVPFVTALPRVQMLQGRLSAWTDRGGVVELSSGATEQVVGKVTVLATGSRYANPLMRATSGTREERLDFYRRFGERIDQARRILIVGGGPIGVELAGEITSRHPGTKLTQVESGRRLLGGSTGAAAAHATAVLQSRGVEIITDDRVESAGGPSDDVFAPGGAATTVAGRQIAYDLLIWCTGGQPNTAYMKQHFAGLLDARQRIHVTPQLRVVGHSHLFALGDITDLDENKMAWHVAGQVDVAEANVRRVLEGRLEDGDLRAYKAQKGNPAMAVTLGPREGMVHLAPFGLITAGWLNRKIKAAHMLVPKYRKQLGV